MISVIFTVISVISTVISAYRVTERFLSENFQFFEMKFSVYLNRRVFVMLSGHSLFVYV